MVALISDLKFFYKYVPILDAKNSPEGDQTGFLVLCVYTEK